MMNKLLNKQDFLQAGMMAWNDLSVIFDAEKKARFTSTEEFGEFYGLLIDRLLEEEKA
jgi:hypothetical protein